jgi:hypothetical protein
LTVFGWRNNKGCDGFSQGIMGSGDDCEPAGLVDNKNIHTIDALKNESMIIIPVFAVIGLELPFECEDEPDDIEYEKFRFNIP